MNVPFRFVVEGSKWLVYRMCKNVKTIGKKMSTREFLKLKKENFKRRHSHYKNKAVLHKREEGHRQWRSQEIFMGGGLST